MGTMSDTCTLTDSELAEALTAANIPVLLPLLVQLTGDRRWLAEPYLPERNRGLGENNSGGLAQELQDEVRGAAYDAIRHWRDTGDVAVPHPEPDELVHMLSITMGEDVPAEYGPMLAAELELLESPTTTAPIDGIPDGFTVLIVGAGVGGIAAAVRLGDAGVTYSMIERNPGAGGTWYQNRYPGCGVDTPSALYSFSFAQHDWTKFFALRDELRDYLDEVIDDNGLRDRIRFETELVAARYDGARQDWEVELREPGGSIVTERYSLVLSAVGGFSRPKYPAILGLHDFSGDVLHTARWPEGYDLSGKRVAVIGNGASSMQLVPAIVGSAASVTVLQRSPQWAAPFELLHAELPEQLRELSRSVPIYRAWYRLRAGWTFNDRIHAALQKDPEWPHPERAVNRINDAHRRFFTRYIEDEIGDDPELLAKVMPDYPPYGKRILMDNGWFRALTRDDVELITESVAAVEGSELVLESGGRREVDVIVCATGFETSRFLAPIEIHGRDGIDLREVWEDDDARAFLGTAVPGFPNFFMLFGPNIAGGHGGSLIGTTEAQLDYLTDLLRRLFAAGQVVAEVKPEPYERYSREVDEAHERMIWTHPGMTTYYRNSKGRIIYAIPWRVVDFWNMTRAADLDDFVTEPAARSPQPTAA